MWSGDGNLDYLGSEHAPLFVIAVAILMFLWIPYTLFITLDSGFESYRTSIYFPHHVKDQAFLRRTLWRFEEQSLLLDWRIASSPCSDFPDIGTSSC